MITLWSFGSYIGLRILGVFMFLVFLFDTTVNPAVHSGTAAALAQDVVLGWGGGIGVSATFFCSVSFRVGLIFVVFSIGWVFGAGAVWFARLLLVWAPRPPKPSHAVT